MNNYWENRISEIIPGAIIWLTLILGVSLSFVKPLWVIYFIILFDLFWVLRLIYFIFFLLISYKQYRKSTKTDWYAKLRALPGWEKHYHLIFLPTYGEPLDVLENTFTELTKINYPLDKLVVVLGGEARKHEDFGPKADVIKEKFGNTFYKLLITEHELADDEIPGKGSNLNFMGRQIKKWVDEKAIPYEDIIVSSFEIGRASCRERV